MIKTMDNYNDDEEGMDPLDEIKQLELEELLVEEAFDNSYRLLIESISFEDLLGSNTKRDISTLLIYDPDEGPELDELEAMLDYYIDDEEYERCAKIRDIIDEMFPIV